PPGRPRGSGSVVAGRRRHDDLWAQRLDHRLRAAPLERAELVLVLPLEPDAVVERLERGHASAIGARGRTIQARIPTASRAMPSATSPPARIHCAPGTFTSFSPLSRSTVPSAMRRSTSGILTVKRLVISTPGIEPVSSHAVAW